MSEMMGRQVQSCEAVLQAAKMLRYGRNGVARDILSTKNGYDAKKEGGRFGGGPLNEQELADWESRDTGAVVLTLRLCVCEKVSRVRALYTLLDEAGVGSKDGMEVIEASRDSKYGAGMTESELTARGFKYKGRNLHGKALEFALVFNKRLREGTWPTGMWEEYVVTTGGGGTTRNDVEWIGPVPDAVVKAMYESNWKFKEQAMWRGRGLEV